MSDANTMREVSVKRLGLCAGAGTGRGVSNVAQAKITPKVDHVMGLEDVLDEAIFFTQMETAAFGGDDAGSVLTTMLEDREAVKYHLVDMGIFVSQENSNNTAHDVM
mmetsp:Transcript_27629/g.58388  ORF Transcript_27629/g.58388 Transcript_27629/m.58388 type:complete len:107 (+) Transcript_27629:1548-1868(+)